MKLRDYAFGIALCISPFCSGGFRPAAIFSDPNMKFLDRLVVDESSGINASIKSREEGEKDMVELAKTGKLEEFWIFADYGSHNVWLDAGYEQETDSVYSKYSLMEKLDATDLKSVSFYHYHPSGNYQGFDDSQVPSTEDIKMCYYRTYKSLKKYPGIDVDCRIAVTSGVYTIKISLSSANGESVCAFIQEATTSMTAEFYRSFLSVGLLNYSSGNSENFVSENEKLARMFSNEALKIEFKKKP